MKERVILRTHTMPEHVVIVIRTVPLYVPPPKMPSAYIYRPVYVEYPIQVIHPEEMV
jgi:hypothetical protein